MSYRSFKDEAPALEFMKRYPGSVLLWDWATHMFVVEY